MIYVVGTLAGVLNGLFSSGGGQILLLYLIYMKNNNDKKTRSTILATMIVLSLITTMIYFFKGSRLTLDFNLIFLIISAIIGGLIGQYFMKKMKAFYLNIFAGILLCILSIKQLFFS